MRGRLGTLVILASVGLAGLVPAGSHAQMGGSVQGTGRTGVAPAGGPRNTRLRLINAQTVHGNYQAAGCGMRNLGACTIQIANIPANSSVVAAYLVWTLLLNDPWQQHDTGTFNGSPITGALAGTGQDPCWGNDDSVTLWTNVATLMNPGGNGTYALTNFPSGDTNGQDPFIVGSDPPMLDGASLVVVYTAPGAPLQRVVTYFGNWTTLQASISERFKNFISSANGPSTATEIISDGQSNATARDQASFDEHLLSGNFYGEDPQAVAPYSAGDLHDTMSRDVTPYVKVGATSFSVELDAGPLPGYTTGDCVVWDGEVFSTPETT